MLRPIPRERRVTVHGFLARKPSEVLSSILSTGFVILVLVELFFLSAREGPHFDCPRFESTRVSSGSF